jgi:hypothetical protein
MNSMQFEFDTVVNHLVEQGERAAIDHGDGSASCKYRIKTNDKVLSCAVGCRIPDEIYTKSMDADNGFGVYNLIHNYKSLPEEIKQYKDMFAELQGVHDDPSSWAELELSEYGIEQLCRVAKTFNLTCNL